MAATWLNAGVPTPQVAEWAGHSMNVLLRVYAPTVDPPEAEARQGLGKGIIVLWASGIEPALSATAYGHSMRTR